MTSVPRRGWLAHVARRPGPFMTRGVSYSTVFLFVLSLFLAAGNYLLSASAVRHAAASAASTMQLCQSGNEARAQQVILWTHLIAISQPPPAETRLARARREKTVAAFLAYVRTVFAPRDCQVRASSGSKP